MATIISMVLVGDVFQSEGEISLGPCLDQVMAFSEFPADLGMAVYVEVRLDEADTEDVTVSISLQNDAEDSASILGAQTVPVLPRGDDWPFPPDVPLVFPISVAIPGESWALLTARIDGVIAQTKWVRAVAFPLLGA